LDVLVTGANGFLGRYLIAALQERGDTARALVLPVEDATWLEERGVATYRGDIRDARTVSAPMRGADAVFHLAGMIGMWRPMRDYYDVNVKGTENVCRAALAEGVGRLVHVSSTIVYGLDLRRCVGEDVPLKPFRDPYALTKAEGDRVVQRMIAEEKLPAVIIRPDQFFGPGDRLHFAHFADRLRAGNGVIIGSGDNALPLIYVTDVVDGLLRALDSHRALGQAYNITCDDVLTQEEYLCAIARATGAARPHVHVPYPVLFAAAFVLERVASLTHSRRRPPATPLGIAFLGTSSRHSNEKARRELGFSPRVPLGEGVQRTALWYLDQDAPTPCPLPVAAR
jgi:nucleoside-diphosphate-sugar epimerase